MIEKQIIGKSENEAKNILNKNEKKYRIMKRDKEFYMTTCDYHSDRFNLYIENDIVKEVSMG